MYGVPKAETEAMKNTRNNTKLYIIICCQLFLEGRFNC